jgi:(E)-4-hydroxy-3-methylbut-2-enyl-diphosphate synthase
MFLRTQTKLIQVGNVRIGHANRVVIQSMTNTKTSNIHSTVDQINALVDQGCELVRVAILDQSDLEALPTVIKQSPCPIIADIHYNTQFAIGAILAGASKIRINPGNISNLNDLKQIVNTAKQYNTAIRLGFNSGS